MQNYILKFPSDQTVILIGTGRLASILGSALQRAGYPIVQVLGRDHERTAKLALHLHSKPIFRVEDLQSDATFYLLAVSDDAIPQLAQSMGHIRGICAHVSGTVGMRVFEGVLESYGVFYPLQTFSEGREISLKEVPFLIEGNNENSCKNLMAFASSISDKVYPCSSEERKAIHLSAVFASNFVNALLGIGQDMISKTTLPADILHPLVIETVSKALETGAVKAQTGPAIRGDFKTIHEHISMLREHPELASLYLQISDLIVNRNKK